MDVETSCEREAGGCTQEKKDNFHSPTSLLVKWTDNGELKKEREIFADIHRYLFFGPLQLHIQAARRTTPHTNH